MPLFVAEHHHSAQSCPAVGRWAAPFRTHLSAANAARYGVAIQAEAVVIGEHRLILTVEAADREHVRNYMAFFVQFGGIAVLPAVTSDDAVALGQCAEQTPQS